MPVSRAALVAFNRGILSPKALARVDLKRTELSAEQQKNWMPRTLGSMMLRPGLKFIGEGVSGQRAVYLPFIRAFEDTALMEFTFEKLRIWVVDTEGRDAALVTRGSVSTLVLNPEFDPDLTDWDTGDSEAGASVTEGVSNTWNDSGTVPAAALLGTGFNRAILKQEVTVASGDQNKRHAVRITIGRGPVTLRIGSTSGDDDYVAETKLGTGNHSLAFTPTGNFWIWFASDAAYTVYVYHCQVEAAGIMELPTTAVYRTQSDLEGIRWGQSVDVVYNCSQNNNGQFKVERRDTDSWSFVRYEPVDGPFRVQNLENITLTPSALKGDITVTASRPIFDPDHLRALFRIQSLGQTALGTVAGDDQFSDYVQISSIGQGRNLHITTTGTWMGTLTLQRSVGAPGAWEDEGTTYTTNQTDTIFNDTFDNDLIFYRLGFKSGDYTSGTADITLFTSVGSIDGIVRVTEVTDSTHINAVVLKTLGGLSASENWWEGLWSKFRGFPSAVDEPYEDRLPWAGKDFIVQSVSGAYESFDDTIEGDSGPIIRSIGSGPVDVVGWILGVQRLILGGDCRVYSIRSSSLDEPLTPTNWNLKGASTIGSAHVPGARLDADIIYVDASQSRIYRLSFDPQYFSGIDYTPTDLTKIAPELGDELFVRIAIQRKPDTRIHCVRNDGTAAVLVFDPLEEVSAWVEVETDGFIEDVVVLPGLVEDLVFYSILREPGDYSAQHTLELWALESECQGGDLNKQADCFTEFTVGGGSPTTDVTGIPAFLIGQEVVLWADGQDQGGVDRNTFTVVSDGSGGGKVVAPVPVSHAVSGLYYEAPYQSTKLAYGGGQLGTALTLQKDLKNVGLVAGTLHAQGLKLGQDFDHMNDLPGTEGDRILAFGEIWAAYDRDPIPIDFVSDTDSRICLLAQAPRPAEVLGLALGLDTTDAI